jgi:hypothetical protein
MVMLSAVIVSVVSEIGFGFDPAFTIPGYVWFLLSDGYLIFTIIDIWSTFYELQNISCSICGYVSHFLWQIIFCFNFPRWITLYS